MQFATRSLIALAVLFNSLVLFRSSSFAQNNPVFPIVTTNQSIQATLDAQPGKMLISLPGVLRS